MESIFGRIAYFAARQPRHTAIADGRVAIGYLQLQQEVERISSTLHLKPMGLLLSNGCAWALLDLAAQYRGTVCVPLPAFFSDIQLRHLIADAGLELIVTDQPARVLTLTATALKSEIVVAGRTLACIVTTAMQGHDLPPATAKITYTSGTTAQPKGVCLTGGAMQQVCVSLASAVAANDADRTLSLLPLSTLLANIAGLYAPLYSGGTACVPDLAECGLQGSTGVQAQQLLAALQRHQPSVIVLVPHLLKVLVEAATRGARIPASLRYIAVGGAPVAPLLLRRARALGLPVYEGYGLSEAASVVSLNVPECDCIGSVGRPLPHARVRVAADGEILVGGNLFSGYLGQPFSTSDEWATGDLGFIDGSGRLYLTGRKKTAFATAHGRKLAPEWIESELTGTSSIAQAALFGEGRNWNVAVVVPTSAASQARLTADIAAVNRTLPDYARVKDWIVADEPFSLRNGLASGVGAINRQAIATRYATLIEGLYEGQDRHAIL
jgi:long-subunit acyl-CoA synthetase (AMP-forming)